MAEKSIRAGGCVIPSFRYRNAPAAIDWLGRAFGFEANLVVPGENGTVIHAQLVFDGSMIMLGSADSHGGNPYDQTVRPADEFGGKVSGGVYVIVADADAHYARALAAGADMLTEVEDADHGGRGYTCRDLEGQVWSFGTYDPMASD
jgi:uncharacterized glyoxalase superfamily protein PhnB